MTEKELRVWFIIILIVILVTLILCIITYIKNVFFQKSFYKGKVRLRSGVIYDLRNKDDKAFIDITNRTFNGINIISIGFLVENKTYDYMQVFRLEHNIPDDTKVFAPSRETVTLKLSFDQILAFFSGEKVPKIKVYVIDNIGRVTTKNAKEIRKLIQAKCKPLYDAKTSKEKEDYASLSKEDKMAYNVSKKEEADRIRDERIKELESLKDKAYPDLIAQNIEEAPVSNNDLNEYAVYECEDEEYTENEELSQEELDLLNAIPDGGNDASSEEITGDSEDENELEENIADEVSEEDNNESNDSDNSDTEPASLDEEITDTDEHYVEELTSDELFGEEKEETEE